MKLVTYDAGEGAARRRPRRRDVVDAGFDGDMVAFIEAGAPGRRRRRGRPGPRLLAPLRPRTLRDFLAFEGHLKNAYRASGATSRPSGTRSRLLQGHARHRRRARTRGAVAALLRPARPRARARRRDRPDRSRTSRPSDAAGLRSSATRSGTTSRRATCSAARSPSAWGPGKAKDWDGSNVLGPCIVTADEFDAADARHARAGQRRALGRGHERPHAPHLRRHGRLRLARQTLRPGEVIGSGRPPAARASSSAASSQEGDVVELEVEGIGVLRNTIGRKGA